MKYHRTRDAASLVVVDHEGIRYAIRGDLKDPSLLHEKTSWPSGRRYWRPLSWHEWARLPKPVRLEVIRRLALPDVFHVADAGGAG